ncbi:MAG: DVUA0089 family protein, partial [Phycisphaeraceae bacterium]|nr:DVUA0089 family protein [Phycisphaeraceae bacterium]
IGMLILLLPVTAARAGWSSDDSGAPALGGLQVTKSMTTAIVVGGLVFESGEAGQLPDTVQIVFHPDEPSITSITGHLDFDGDVDVFAIYIDDPEDFSASTDNDGNQLSFWRDTQLFAFDPDGFGVLGADGTPTGIYRSELSAGKFPGPAGAYLLAVSDYDNDPVSIGGEIFPDNPAWGTFLPTGPGSAAPLTDWNADYRIPELGQYRIDLTGARAIPEPTTLALLGAGALLTLRRRVKKSEKGS